MRINRLDLLYYGKFTERSISLPQSDHDFHLICGPNEAGKSTIRSAILDLFFGIETRSTYNFLHEYPNMKLGALIEQDGNLLDFQRTKAAKQSLFDAQGEPCSQDVLRPFLGTADRGYFDQMFGLNHEKLVAGGNEILDSSKDVGQILFQTAVGVDGLGKARDALRDEADKIWAARKSKDRDYYMALEAFEDAKAELKRVTVKTKDWVEAQNQVKQLEESLEQSKTEFRNLDAQRVCLERVRRMAPELKKLQEKESVLDELGEVVILPVDAEKQFNIMLQTLAHANHELSVYKKNAETLQERLAKVNPDESLLKYNTEILLLVEQQPLIRQQKTEIIKRQETINHLQQQIKILARQLDWRVEDEQKWASQLPGLPIRATIASLLKRYHALQQASLLSKQSADDKAEEINALDMQIASLPVVTISAEFRAALTAAQHLGDVSSQSKRLEEQVIKAKQALESIQLSLGQWNLCVDELRQLVLPTKASITSFQKRFAKEETAVNNLIVQLETLTEVVLAKEFEVTQYQKAHHAVTVAEVKSAREARDTTWASIKSGAASLQETAAAFEAKIDDADLIADKRYDKAQEASTLQSKQDSLEELQQQQLRLQVRLETSRATLLAVQQEWLVALKEMKLPAIPLSDIDAWLQARERVIVAADNVVEANQALARWKQEETQVKDTLLNCINEHELNANATRSLSALIIVATDSKDEAVQTQARREELTKQRKSAASVLIALNEKASAAQSDMVQWQSNWRENLNVAGIQRNTEIGAVEGQLSLFDELDQKFRDIEDIRGIQITSQMDVDNFEKDVARLMMSLAPELKGQSSLDIVKAFVSQLEKAKTDQKEQKRLRQEVRDLEEKNAEVSLRVASVTGEIDALLQCAKVTTNDELSAAIKRSDDWQRLNETIAIIKNTLLEQGDGLTRAQLEAELASTNVPEILVNLKMLAQQQEEIQRQQNALSADLATAKTELAKIAGQDDAVRAESTRQEALAKMAEVAERYIKVHTASKLLQWAINRYRETKQGPMLVRTSGIFAGLTLGSFQKLVVDFDQQPLALKGQRDNGKLVDITGMSEGTRDQLYLALRLAALELYFEQSQPLPFIADDLFVNFDDARAKAGLQALANLSKKTQIIFLSHHDHLVSIVQAVFGKSVNIVRL